MTIKVSFFVYSETAQLHQVTNTDQQQESKLQIVGPTHVFQPQFIPSLYSFSISTSITGFDLTIPHELRMTFHPSEEDTEIADTNIMNLPPIPEKTDSKLPPELRGFVFSCDFRNVPIRKNGTYTTKFYFDGELIGVFPIDVWGKESFDQRIS